MITNRSCPVCGGLIAFSYVRPNFDFYIVDGKIEHDTNKELWDGKEPYLDFYCSNDRTHLLDEPINSSRQKYSNTFGGFTKWCDKVEREFYKKIFPYL